MDPEGASSTLPAIATALSGILTGHLLRPRRPPIEKAAWILAGSNLLIGAGLALSIWMPINKKIWTTPYSIFMAGLAAVCVLAPLADPSTAPMLYGVAWFLYRGNWFLRF